MQEPRVLRAGDPDNRQLLCLFQSPGHVVQWLAAQRSARDTLRPDRLGQELVVPVERQRAVLEQQ